MQFINGLLTGNNIINLFFKSFSLIFSILYLIYAIVVLKQVQVISDTVQSKTNNTILTVSIIQIFIGVILIYFALTVL